MAVILALPTVGCKRALGGTGCAILELTSALQELQEHGRYLEGLLPRKKMASSFNNSAFDETWE